MRWVLCWVPGTEVTTTPSGAAALGGLKVLPRRVREARKRSAAGREVLAQAPGGRAVHGGILPPRDPALCPSPLPPLARERSLSCMVLKLIVKKISLENFKHTEN